MSFARKLQAVKYPRRENFQMDSFEEFQALIVWLEDNYICCRAQNDRNIRDVAAADWNTAFLKYLADVGYTFSKTEISPQDRIEIMDWLLARAVNFKYNDLAQEYSKPPVAIPPALDNIDFGNEAFKSELRSIADALCIPTQGVDTPLLLKLVANFVREKLSPEALKDLQSYDKEVKFSPEQFPLGFSTGDAALDKAALVLRLLYIADLRDTQSKINSVIATLQSFTANPKTDARLGKVGR
eukprot:gnl/Hemi2/24319_TR8171_c0_g1_i1.p1 gnl/Hemi2/24319_TR8171_c0_g1~~gnl/Hemi2/24319_TR8171_c0_g1_i1.p1  ORF type:complete len:254 (-),score=75.38 gnl/Hemi2/24319_TR8171_c0_g1_i1:112-834(-)